MGNRVVNKTNGTILLMVIAMHGLAGYALIKMGALMIKPPKKITPPIEVVMLKFNHEESSEPPKIEPLPKTQEAKQQPADKLTSANPVKSTLPPKTPNEVVKPQVQPKQPKVQTQTYSQKQVQVPTQDDMLENEKRLSQLAEQAQRDAQQRQAILAAQRQAEQEAQAKEIQRQAEAAAKQQAQRDAQQRQAEQEAAAKRQAEQESAEAAARQSNRESNRGGTSNGGGQGETTNQNKELTNQRLKASDVSWSRRPNYSGISSDKLSGQTVDFIAILTVDAQGNITAVSGVNTGDRNLDKAISRAIRRSKLNPVKSSSGQPTSGKVDYPFSVYVP